MQKTLTFLLPLIILMALVVTTSAQSLLPPAEDATALLKECRKEIEKLRLEVLQQGIEFQAWKIRQLEKEALRVQQQRANLDEQDQLLRQQLAGLDAVSGDSSAADQAGELQAIKTELSDNRRKQLDEERGGIAKLESEVAEQLRLEKNRLQELLIRAKKLRGGS